MLGVSGFWATLDAGGGDPGNSDRMTRHGKPRRKPANFNCQPAASRRRIRSLTFASCMIPARTNVPRGRPTSECEIWSRIRYETRYKFTERSYDQDDGCPAVRFSPSGNARDVSANSQLIALAAAALATNPSVSIAAGPPAATTLQGKAQGKLINEGKVRAFLGLPYAAPPVGQLRWKAPEPPLVYGIFRNQGENLVRPELFAGCK